MTNTKQRLLWPELDRDIYVLHFKTSRWVPFLPDIFPESLNELGRQCAYNQEQWVWSYGALCTCCQATGQGYFVLC